MQQRHLICGAEKAAITENLTCNFVWDPAVRGKLFMHIKDYYDSIEKEDGANKEDIKIATYNETQLTNFPSLIQYEKNEMVAMMSSRFAEWGRRTKENMKLKPFIRRAMEDELTHYLDKEPDEDYDVREDLRNIEGSILTSVAGANKGKEQKKAIKLKPNSNCAQYCILSKMF